MAVGLSATLLAITLSGCGTHGAEVASTLGSDVERIEEHANDVFTRISGTAEQREAVHFLTVGELNKEFIACMSTKGLVVSPEFAPIWAGWEPDATSASWMGALNRPPSIHALATVKARRLERAPAPRKAGYGDAAALCSNVNADTDVAIGGSPGEPPGYLDLTDDFKEVIFAIDEQLGPIAEYTKCMKNDGIDYTLHSEENEGWRGLYLSLSNVMPDPPASEEQPSAEWRKYIEYESAALSADAACRGERHREGLQLLGPQLEEFEQRNLDRIQEVQSQWAAAVDRASRLGFKFNG